MEWNGTRNGNTRNGNGTHDGSVTVGLMGALLLSSLGSGAAILLFLSLSIDHLLGHGRVMTMRQRRRRRRSHQRISGYTPLPARPRLSPHRVTESGRREHGGTSNWVHSRADTDMAAGPNRAHDRPPSR